MRFSSELSCLGKVDEMTSRTCTGGDVFGMAECHPATQAGVVYSGSGVGVLEEKLGLVISAGHRTKGVVHSVVEELALLEDGAGGFFVVSDLQCGNASVKSSKPEGTSPLCKYFLQVD